MEWFAEHPEFDLLPWPAKGADLNPIENLWSEMVREMEATHVQNQNELWDIVSANWNRLKQRNQYWRTLSNSMANRLRLVRDADGNWTKY